MNPGLLNATLRLRNRRVMGGVFAWLIGFAFASPSMALDEAASSASSPEAQATIAFANRGGILNWQVLDDSHLLIEDNHHKWYRATLQSPAIRLAFAEQLGFDTGPTGRLERFSAIVVEGLRYPILSLVSVDSPTKTK